MSLINAGLAELILALLIWGGIEKFGSRSKTRRKLDSFGLFLAIFCCSIAAHAAFATSSMDASQSRESSPAQTEDASAELEANAAEIKAIVRQVVAGGKVDQALHDHFWSLIPLSLRATPKDREELLSAMDTGLSFQRALWQSLLLSAQTHRPTKTKALSEQLPQYGAAAQKKCEDMIQAASLGKPYVLSSGQGAMVIDEAYAKRVLSNLEESSDRINVLFDPVWHG